MPKHPDITENSAQQKESIFGINTYDYFGLKLGGLSDAQINRNISQNGMNVVMPSLDQVNELYGGPDMEPGRLDELYNYAKHDFANYEEGRFVLDNIDKFALGPVGSFAKLKGQTERYSPVDMYRSHPDFENDPRFHPATGARLMEDDVYMKTSGIVVNEKGNGVLGADKVFPHLGVWDNDGIMDGKALKRVYPNDELFNPDLAAHPGAPYLQIVDATQVYKDSEIFSAVGAKTKVSDGWLNSAWSSMYDMTAKNLPSAFGSMLEMADRIATSEGDFNTSLDSLFGASPGTTRGYANMLQNRSKQAYSPGNFEQDEGFGENASATAYAIGSGFASLLQQFVIARTLRLGKVPTRIAGNIGTATFSSVAADGVHQLGKEMEIPEEDMVQLWAATAFTTHAVERGIRFNDNWITDGGMVMAMRQEMRQTLREEVKKGVKAYGKTAWKELSKAERQNITLSVAKRAANFARIKAKGFKDWMKSGTRPANMVAAGFEEGVEEAIENTLHNAYQIMNDYSNYLANPEMKVGEGMFGEIDLNKGMIGNLLAYDETTQSRRLTEGNWESLIIGGMAGGMFGVLRKTNPHQARLMQEYILQGKGKDFKDVMEEMRVKGEFGSLQLDRDGNPLTAAQVAANKKAKDDGYYYRDEEGRPLSAELVEKYREEGKAVEKVDEMLPYLTMNDFNYQTLLQEFNATEKVFKDSGINQWYNSWQKSSKFKNKLLGFHTTGVNRAKWVNSKEYQHFMGILKNGEETLMQNALSNLRLIAEKEAAKEEEGANIEELDREIAELQVLPSEVQSGKAFEDLFKRGYIKQRIQMHNMDLINGRPVPVSGTDFVINQNGKPEQVVDRINQSAMDFIQWNAKAYQAWEELRQKKATEIQEFITKTGGKDFHIKGLNIDEVQSIFNATSEYGTTNEDLDRIANNIMDSVDRYIEELQTKMDKFSIKDSQGKEKNLYKKVPFWDDQLAQPNSETAALLKENSEKEGKEGEFAKSMLEAMSKAASAEQWRGSFRDSMDEQVESKNPYIDPSLAKETTFAAFLSMMGEQGMLEGEQEGDDDESKTDDPLKRFAFKVRERIDHFLEREITDEESIKELRAIQIFIYERRAAIKVNQTVYNEITDDITKMDGSIKMTDAEYQDLDSEMQELLDKLDSILAKYQSREMKEHMYKDQYVRMHRRFLNDILSRFKADDKISEADQVIITQQFEEHFQAYIQLREILGENPTEEALAELQQLQDQVIQGFHGYSTIISKKLNEDPDYAQKIFDDLYGYTDENDVYHKGTYSAKDSKGVDKAGKGEESVWMEESFELNSIGITVENDLHEKSVQTLPFIDSNNLIIQANQTSEKDKYSELNLKKFGIMHQAFVNFFNAITRSDYFDFQVSYDIYLSKLDDDSNAPSFEQKAVIHQVASFLKNPKKYIKRRKSMQDLKSTGDSWIFVQGAAGTGKTSTVLRGIIETANVLLSGDRAMEGKRIVLVSPSKSQRENIDKDITNKVSEGINIISTDNESFFSQGSLDENVGYIVVDEASFLTSEQIKKLKELAGSTPVVFLGDVSQMTSGAEIAPLFSKVSEITNPIEEVFRTGVHHITTIQSAFRAVANTYGASIDAVLPRVEMQSDRMLGVEYILDSPDADSEQVNLFLADIQKFGRGNSIIITADEDAREKLISKIRRSHPSVDVAELVKTMDEGDNTAFGLEYQRVYVNIKQSDYGTNVAGSTYNKAMLTATSRAKGFLNLIHQDMGPKNPKSASVDQVAGTSPEALSNLMQILNTYKVLDIQTQKNLIEYLKGLGMNPVDIQDQADDNADKSQPDKEKQNEVFDALVAIKGDVKNIRPNPKRTDEHGDEDGGYSIVIDSIEYKPRRTSNIIGSAAPELATSATQGPTAPRTFGTIVHTVLDKFITVPSRERADFDIMQAIFDANNPVNGHVANNDRFEWKDVDQMGAIGDAVREVVIKTMDMVEFREEKGSKFITEIAMVDSTNMVGGTIDLIEVNSYGQIITHDYKTGGPKSLTPSKVGVKYRSKQGKWDVPYSGRKSQNFIRPPGATRKDGKLLLPALEYNKKNYVALQQMIYAKLVHSMTGEGVQKMNIIMTEVNTRPGENAGKMTKIAVSRKIGVEIEGDKSVSSFTEQQLIDLEDWADALLKQNMQSSPTPPPQDPPPDDTPPDPPPPPDDTDKTDVPDNHIDVADIDPDTVNDSQGVASGTTYNEKIWEGVNAREDYKVKGLLTATTKSTKGASEGAGTIIVPGPAYNKDRAINLKMMQDLIYSQIRQGKPPDKDMFIISYHNRINLWKDNVGMEPFQNVLAVHWNPEHEAIKQWVSDPVNAAMFSVDTGYREQLPIVGTLFGAIEGNPMSAPDSVDDPYLSKLTELRRIGHNEMDKDGVYVFEGGVQIANITAGSPRFQVDNKKSEYKTLSDAKAILEAQGVHFGPIHVLYNHKYLRKGNPKGPRYESGYYVPISYDKASVVGGKGVKNPKVEWVKLSTAKVPASEVGNSIAEEILAANRENKNISSWDFWRDIVDYINANPRTFIDFTQNGGKGELREDLKKVTFDSIPLLSWEKDVSPQGRGRYRIVLNSALITHGYQAKDWAGKMRELFDKVGTLVYGKIVGPTGVPALGERLPTSRILTGRVKGVYVDSKAFIAQDDSNRTPEEVVEINMSQFNDPQITFVPPAVNNIGTSPQTSGNTGPTRNPLGNNIKANLKSNGEKGRISADQAQSIVIQILGQKYYDNFVTMNGSLHTPDGREAFGYVMNGFMRLENLEGVESTTPRHEALHIIMTHLLDSGYRKAILDSGKKAIAKKLGVNVDSISDTESEEYISDLYGQKRSTKVKSILQDFIDWLAGIAEKFGYDYGVLNNFMRDIEIGLYSNDAAQIITNSNFEGYWKANAKPEEDPANNPNNPVTILNLFKTANVQYTIQRDVIAKFILNNSVYSTLPEDKNLPIIAKKKGDPNAIDYSADQLFLEARRIQEQYPGIEDVGPDEAFERLSKNESGWYEKWAIVQIMQEVDTSTAYTSERGLRAFADTLVEGVDGTLTYVFLKDNIDMNSVIRESSAGFEGKPYYVHKKIKTKDGISPTLIIVDSLEELEGLPLMKQGKVIRDSPSRIRRPKIEYPIFQTFLQNIFPGGEVSNKKLKTISAYADKNPLDDTFGKENDASLWEYIQENGGDSSIDSTENEQKNPLNSFTDTMNMIFNTINFYSYVDNDAGHVVATPIEGQYINIENLKQDLIEIASKAFSPRSIMDGVSDIERFKMAIWDQIQNTSEGSYARNSLMSFYYTVLHSSNDVYLEGNPHGKDGKNPNLQLLGGKYYNTYSLLDFGNNAVEIGDQYTDRSDDWKASLIEKGAVNKDAVMGMVSMFKSITHIDFSKVKYDGRDKSYKNVPVRTSYADDIKKEIDRSILAKLFDFNNGVGEVTDEAKKLFMPRLRVKLKNSEGKWNDDTQWIYEDQIAEYVAQESIYLDPTSGTPKEFQERSKPTWRIEKKKGSTEWLRGNQVVFIKEGTGVMQFSSEVMTHDNPTAQIRKVMYDIGIGSYQISNNTINAYIVGKPLEAINARSGQADLSDMDLTILSNGLGTIINDILNPKNAGVDTLQNLLSYQEGEEGLDEIVTSPTSNSWHFLEQIAAVEQFNRGDAAIRTFFGVRGEQIFRNVNASRVDDIYGYDSADSPAQYGATRLLKMNLIDTMIDASGATGHSALEMRKNLLATEYDKVQELAKQVQESGVPLVFMDENGDYNNPLLDPDSSYRIRGINRLHGIQDWRAGKQYGRMTESDLAHHMIDAVFVSPLVENTRHNNYQMPGPTPGDKKSPILYKVEHIGATSKLVSVQNGKPILNQEFVVEQTLNIFDRRAQKSTLAIERFMDTIVPIILQNADQTALQIANLTPVEIIKKNPRLISQDGYQYIKDLNSIIPEESMEQIKNEIKKTGLIENRDYVFVDNKIWVGNDVMADKSGLYNWETYDLLINAKLDGNVSEQFRIIDVMHQNHITKLANYLKNEIGYKPGSQIGESTGWSTFNLSETKKEDGSNQYDINPWIKTYYYGFHIFNSHVNEIVTSPAEAFKNMVDQYKRAQSDKAPGVVPVIDVQGMMPHYEILIVKDNPDIHTLVGIVTNADPTAKAAEDGATFQTPLFSIAAYDGLGGKIGSMSDIYQVTKQVHKERNLATQDSKYIKTAGFTLGAELMRRSRKTRALVKRMLSRKTFDEVGKEGSKGINLWLKYEEFESDAGVADPWIELREYYKKQDTPQFIELNGFSIHEAHIAQIVQESAIKEGKQLVHNLEDVLSGVSDVEGTVKLDSKGTRFQLNPFKDPEKDDASMLKQLLSQALIGADTDTQNERAARVAELQAEITAVGIDLLAIEIGNKGLEAYLRELSERSVANMGTAHALIAVLLNDPKISDQVPVIASRTRNVLIKRLNEIIKPRMHGYSAVQAPGTLIEVYEKNGVPYTLAEVQDNLGQKNFSDAFVQMNGFTPRKLNHTKIYIKNEDLAQKFQGLPSSNTGWIDIDETYEFMVIEGGLEPEQAKTLLRELLAENLLQKKIIPGEVVAPFTGYENWGLNNDVTSLNYYKNWDVNSISQISAEIDEETAAILTEAGLIVESGVFDTTYDKLGSNPSERIEILKLLINSGKLNYEKTGMVRILAEQNRARRDRKGAVNFDGILQQLPIMLERYNSSLDIIANRIPSSGMGSGSHYRIISYHYEGGNYIFTSTTKNVIDNSDFDVDELRVLERNLNADITDIDKLSNKLFDQLVGYYADASNAPFFLSPVSTTEPNNESVKIQDILETLEAKEKKGYNLFANDPVSNLVSYGQNMGGKYTVGAFVLAMKGYTHLYHAYKGVKGKHFNFVFKGKTYSSFINNKKGIASASEDGEYIINLLGELSQLALDNAQLTILTKIMANPDTAFMIASLDVVGVPRREIVEFLTSSPIVRTLTTKLLSNNIDEKTKTVLDVIDDTIAETNSVIDQIDEMVEKSEKDDTPLPFKEISSLLTQYGILTDKDGRKDRYKSKDGEEISRGSVFDQTAENIKETSKKASNQRNSKAERDALKEVTEENTGDLKLAFNAAVRNLLSAEDNMIAELEIAVADLQIVFKQGADSKDSSLRDLSIPVAAALIYKMKIVSDLNDWVDEIVPMIEAMYDNDSVPDPDTIRAAIDQNLKDLDSLRNATLFGEFLKRASLTANMDQGINNDDFASDTNFQNMQLWSNQAWVGEPIVSSNSVEDKSYYIREQSFAFSSGENLSPYGILLPTKREQFLAREAQIRSYGDIGFLIESNPHLQEYAKIFTRFDEITKEHYIVKKSVELAKKVILPDIKKYQLWSAKDYNVLQGTLNSYFIAKWMGKFYSGKNMSLGRSTNGGQIGNIDLSTPEGRHQFIAEFPAFVKMLQDNPKFQQNAFFSKLQVAPTSSGLTVGIPNLNKLEPSSLASLQSSLVLLEKESTGKDNNGSDMNNFAELYFLYEFIKGGFSQGPSKALNIMPPKMFHSYSSFIDEMSDWVNNNPKAEGILQNELNNQFKEQFLIGYKNSLLPVTDKNEDYSIGIDPSEKQYATGIITPVVTDKNPIGNFPKYIRAKLRIAPSLRRTEYTLRLNDELGHYEIILSKFTGNSLGFEEDAVFTPDDTIKGTIPLSAKNKLKLQKEPTVTIETINKVRYPVEWTKFWAKGWNMIVEARQAQLYGGTRYSIRIPEGHLSSNLGTKSIQNIFLGNKQLDMFLKRIQRSFPNVTIKKVNDSTYYKLFGVSEGAGIKDGIVYLNVDKVSLDQPAHELGHIWIALMRTSNTELYEYLMNEAKGSPLYNVIKKHPNYRHRSDVDILEEVLATSIGFATGNTSKSEFLAQITPEEKPGVLHQISNWFRQIMMEMKRQIHALFGFRISKADGTAKHRAGYAESLSPTLNALMSEKMDLPAWVNIEGNKTWNNNDYLVSTLADLQDESSELDYLEGSEVEEDDSLDSYFDAMRAQEEMKEEGVPDAELDPEMKKWKERIDEVREEAKQKTLKQIRNQINKSIARYGNEVIVGDKHFYVTEDGKYQINGEEVDAATFFESGFNKYLKAQDLLTKTKKEPLDGLNLGSISMYGITTAMADAITNGNLISNVTSEELASILGSSALLSSTLENAEDIANSLVGANKAEQDIKDRIIVKQNMIKAMQISKNVHGEYHYKTNGGKLYKLNDITNEQAVDKLVGKIITERGKYQTTLSDSLVDFLNGGNVGALPESLQHRAESIQERFQLKGGETIHKYSSLRTFVKVGETDEFNQAVRALYHSAIGKDSTFDPLVVIGKDNQGGLVVSIHDITASSLNKVYGDSVQAMLFGNVKEQRNVLSTDLVKLSNTEVGKRKLMLLLTLAGMTSKNPNITYRKINIHQISGNVERTEGLVIADYIPELKSLVGNPEMLERLGGDLALLANNPAIYDISNYQQSWIDSLIDYWGDEKRNAYSMAKQTDSPTILKNATTYSALENKMIAVRDESKVAEDIFSSNAERIVKDRMDQLMRQQGSNEDGRKALYNDEEFQLLSMSLRSLKNRGRIKSSNTIDLNKLTMNIKGNFNLANPIAQWFIREMKRSFDIVGNRYRSEYKSEFEKLVTPVIKYYEETNPLSLVTERIADRSFKIFDDMFIKDIAYDKDGKKYTVNTFRLYHSKDIRTQKRLDDGILTKDHVALADFIVKNMREKVVKTRMSVEYGTEDEKRKAAEEWYANNWVEGAIPLIQKRPMQKIFGGDTIGDIGQGFKDLGMQFTRSDELYDYITGSQDTNGYGMNDLFAWQAGPSDLGSDKRMKMMGLNYDENGKLMMRDDGGTANRNIETNLETVMNYFNMNQLLKQEMDTIMPEYLAANTLLHNYEGSKGEKFKNYISYLDRTMNYIIKNKRQGIGLGIPIGSGKKVSVDDVLHTANGLVSFGIMGGNIYADTVNFMSNALAISSLAYGQTLANLGGESDFFTYGDLMKAAKKASTNPTLMWKLVEQYRFAQMDHKDMLHRKGLQKTKKRFALFQSNWLFGLNFAGDYVNRAIVLMAQMTHDGVLDAYSVNKETGKLEYNEKKDPRPAKVRERIKQELIREGVQDANEPLQRAYDSRLKTRVKTIADKYITGSYDAETDRLLNSHILGKTFSMFKKYAFDKLENWGQRGHYNDALGKYEVVEIDDPFLPGGKKMQVVWQDRFVEGTLISIFAMIGEAKKLSTLPMSEYHKIWTDQEPARKENIIRITHDAAMITAIIQVLPFLLSGSEDDEDRLKEEGIHGLWNSRLWRSVEYSALDLIWGSNPNEYIRVLGDPFVTITQLKRYIALIESFFTGEASKMDSASKKTFGLYRSVSDIYDLSTKQ